MSERPPWAPFYGADDEREPVRDVDPLDEALDRALALMPLHLHPTAIELTARQLAELRMLADARKNAWAPADPPYPETWRGVPIKVVNAGGPTILTVNRWPLHPDLAALLVRIGAYDGGDHIPFESPDEALAKGLQEFGLIKLADATSLATVWRLTGRGAEIRERLNSEAPNPDDAQTGKAVLDSG